LAWHLRIDVLILRSLDFGIVRTTMLLLAFGASSLSTLEVLSSEGSDGIIPAFTPLRSAVIAYQLVNILSLPKTNLLASLSFGPLATTLGKPAAAKPA
jgi:hypothetical protein